MGQMYDKPSKYTIITKMNSYNNQHMLYKVRNHEGAIFVLKMVPDSNKEDVLKEFKNLQKFDSDNILKAYEAHEMLTCNNDICKLPNECQNYCPGGIALIFEHCDGGDLNSLIEYSSAQVSLDVKVKYACQIITALDLIHSKEIIRRDMTPHNIFLKKSKNGDGVQEQVAVIGDFGGFINKNVGQSKIHHTKVATQQLFVAPEIVEGKPYCAVADSYNLGIILLQLFHSFPYGTTFDDWVEDYRQDDNKTWDKLTKLEGIPPAMKLYIWGLTLYSAQDRLEVADIAAVIKITNDGHAHALRQIEDYRTFLETIWKIESKLHISRRCVRDCLGVLKEVLDDLTKFEFEWSKGRRAISSNLTRVENDIIRLGSALTTHPPLVERRKPIKIMERLVNYCFQLKRLWGITIQIIRMTSEIEMDEDEVFGDKGCADKYDAVRPNYSDIVSEFNKCEVEWRVTEKDYGNVELEELKLLVKSVLDTVENKSYFTMSVCMND